jgi:hypothetical protein
VFAELLGVLATGEAEDGHVYVAAAEGMAARAQVGAKGYLVRPVAVNHDFAEFAFSVAHGASLEMGAARSALLAGKDAGSVRVTDEQRYLRVQQRENKTGALFKNGRSKLDRDACPTASNRE